MVFVEVYVALHVIVPVRFRVPFLKAARVSVGEAQGVSTGPPPARSTVTVRILNRDIIRIEEVGSSVNFTCRAKSRIRNTPLQITWSKEDGNLPYDRVYADPYSGLLRITNLQVSDSGVYVCQSSDGISTGSESVTLKVPGKNLFNIYYLYTFD